MSLKGIVLAGGSGTRLHPVTLSISKQLLPVYDKPMIYYSICTLMLAGVQDILLISTPGALPLYDQLLGDGRQWGISINYAEQAQPSGIAQGLSIGRQFAGKDRVALALGDNIFFGHGFPDKLRIASQRASGATIFTYRVHDPERYGVVEIDESGTVLSLEEKPARPKSNLAVTGLYFYDNRVFDIAECLPPSARGEYEITDINRWYMDRRCLTVEHLGRGIAWLDAGTHRSLLRASTFIEAVETRQGLKVCCPEEIAYRSGYINAEQLKQLAEALSNSSYGQYLQAMASGQI